MGLRRYADFSGRSRRREYWMFALINVGIIVALTVLDAVTGSLSESAGIGLLSGLYCLAALVPSIAVSVRRLHDTGKSAWWILIGLIPLVGGIIALVFMATPGNSGPNVYGPDPKESRSMAATMVY